MSRRRLVALFVACCTALSTFAGIAQADSGSFALEVVAAQLRNPRGLTVASDGTVYVAEAGRGGRQCETIESEGEEFTVCFGTTSGVTRIRDGRQTRVVTGLPSEAEQGGIAAVGTHGVALTRGGKLLLTTGGFGDLAERRSVTRLFPPARLRGRLLVAEPNGDISLARDITRLETVRNPDGLPDEGDGINGNPWHVIRDGRARIVTDSGGNALWRFRPGRRAQVLAAFTGPMVTNPFTGERMRAQSVPTGLAEGPDGAYYVGELTGFPFEKGSARVWRVVPGRAPTVFARGFTNIGGLAFDQAGNLLVVEMATDGLLAEPENPRLPPPGRLVRVNRDGSRETLVSKGLFTPMDVAVSRTGAIYVTNHGFAAEDGTVVKVNLR
jgi:DNA-binding beta-propeller fold protein YncE